MTKGYWIVRVDVRDPDTYAQYVKANAEPFARYGARFLARAGKHEVVEGSARSRNVVIEFPSFEQALACYRDEAYQKAKAIRDPVATADVIVIEGFDGPQPGA